MRRASTWKAACLAALMAAGLPLAPEPRPGLELKGGVTVLIPDRALDTPEAAILEFYAAWDTRDRDRLLAVLSADRRAASPPDYLHNTKMARVLNIEAGRATIKADDYHRQHPYLHAVKTFMVTFEIAFFEERSMTNGVHAWNLIVVRERPDGPWLIADWGW